MRKRDRAAFVAAAGALAWVVWYDVLQCPGCRAARQAASVQRERERHNTRHVYSTAPTTVLGGSWAATTDGKAEF
jgi:hypothetical protein